MRKNIFAFVSLVMLVSVASAQDFTGKQVVVTTDSARLMDKDKEVAKVPLGEVLVVDKVNGPWLFIRDRAGWIQAKDVVLFEQAEAHFTREIQKNGSARNYYQRAAIRMMQRQLGPAIEDFSRVIQLEPKLAAGYGMRAAAHHDQGELDLAIADYNEVIRLEPDNPAGYHNRASAWHHKRDFDKAIADYDKVIQLDPKFAEAYNNRGLAWYAKGEFDKAIADYDKALSLDPSNTVALSNRGNARIQKREYQPAIDDFTAAIELYPNDLWSYLSRGEAYRRSGEFAQAIADYRTASQLNARLPLPHSTLAWLMATCPDEQYRDGKQAIEEGTAACELSQWRDHRALDALAAAHAEAGDFDEAIKWQEKAIELGPETVDEAYQNRLALYQDHKPYRDTNPQ